MEKENFGKKVTRRDFIKKSAKTGLGVGLGLTAMGSINVATAESGKKTTELTPLTFISPRGTLEVMDDYNLWAAIELGYFKEMGLEVTMEPGPADAFACTKFVDQNQADIGFPSPGILTSSIDTGMSVIGNLHGYFFTGKILRALHGSVFPHRKVPY
ncbi:MAG TPA: twin-arginine translocation signal domain-containing protein [Spirochaetes bacterium]|nr:twin-arginine translocation signal domain-containing protein [Spirochaetota bacterium]